MPSGDNGNVFQILNKFDPTRSAAFTYDPLNRIAQANTINTSGSNCWGEVYTIDAWGNLTNRSGVSGMAGNCLTEPLSQTASSQNQLSGLSYDIAGNIVNDGSGNTPTYDAESRIVTDEGVTYSYDANGVRIEKSSGTMYWPGPSGTLAETGLSGTINEEYIYFNGERIARVDRPSGTVHYYFSNHLGSASVITDASGNVDLQTDYYPFGGVAYTNGSDPNHYKFTGKEFDSESTLDNFGARYLSSTMGRFMTPDWAARPTTVPYAEFGDPQSLNLYTYVRNDPVTDADADGHMCIVSPQDGGDVCNAIGGGGTGDTKTDGTKDQKPCKYSACVTAQIPDVPMMAIAFGHHGLPRSLFRFLPRGAARTWLERWVTGPLDGPHFFDKAHRLYNKEVEDLLELDTEEGKEEVARDVIKAAQKILDSDNPAIKGFLDNMSTSNGMTGRQALQQALEGDGEAAGQFVMGAMGEVVEGAAEIE